MAEQARFFIWRQLGKDRGIQLLPRLREKVMTKTLDWTTASRSNLHLYFTRCVTFISWARSRV